jgi:hypothetical protein
MADADKNFFNKSISGDETWCFAFDPETKRQSSEWFGDIPSDEEPEISKMPHQDILIIFSTLKGQCTMNSYQREKQ